MKKKKSVLISVSDGKKMRKVIFDTSKPITDVLGLLKEGEVLMFHIPSIGGKLGV